MSGLQRLSDEERQEMLEDSMNTERSKAFNSARVLSQQGTLDEYITFLSQNISDITITPSRRITTNYKL